MWTIYINNIIIIGNDMKYITWQLSIEAIKKQALLMISINNTLKQKDYDQYLEWSIHCQQWFTVDNELITLNIGHRLLSEYRKIIL